VFSASPSNSRAARSRGSGASVSRRLGDLSVLPQQHRKISVRVGIRGSSTIDSWSSKMNEPEKLFRGGQPTLAATMAMRVRWVVDTFQA
jgi:hypothetical protein